MDLLDEFLMKLSVFLVRFRPLFLYFLVIKKVAVFVAVNYFFLLNHMVTIKHYLLVIRAPAVHCLGEAMQALVAPLQNLLS